MLMALQNTKPTSLLTAACLPHTMVEQNYTALHDIVELLLKAALHRDKICLGQLELRATAQGSGSKKLRPVLTLSEGDPQRCCLGAQEAVSPHVAHGDSRSRDATLRSPWLPAAANGAESCTLGRVVSGDGGPAAAGRLAPCCLLGGAPQPWQPARPPLRRGKKSWITPAARIQLASLGQHAPGGQTVTLACSACHKVWTSHRCPRREQTVRAWREPTQCSLQSTSIASSSCQGKLLPSCS